ncbi:hypothetical protein BH23GEM11_BH23GEM11_08520 [soil metagenome]
MWLLALIAIHLSPLSQEPPGDAALDSSRVVSEAREAQARFERARVFHAPWGNWSGGGTCDEQIGRFCLRFTSGRDDETTPPRVPPPEVEAVLTARARLDSALTVAAGKIPGDAWIAGQRTWYRGEAGDWEGALEAARACQSIEPGWCALLEGYAHHGAGHAVEAERRFDEGVAALPAAEREKWMDLEPLLELEVAQALRRLPAEERGLLEDRIWALGNPFFLVGGNTLRSEHFARHTAARIQERARNPHGIRWGQDMTEILVRFGPLVAFERSRQPGVLLGPTPVSGRFSLDARGVFPSLEAILNASEAGPREFPPAVHGARSRHSPPSVPRIRGLQARVSRFRRGDSLLVVAAWRVPEAPAWDSVPPVRVSEAGLFLVREGEAQPLRFDLPASPGGPEASPDQASHPSFTSLRSGVGVVLAPTGAWWLSLEAADTEGGRGWRFRQGLRQDPREPGEIQISDLLLLSPPRSPGGDASATGGGPPDRLEDHVGRALPTDTIAAGPIEVAWEIYGEPPDPERLQFVIGIEREDRGLFRRAGEALRLLSPVDPVEMRWEEGVAGGRPDLHEPVRFRRLELDLGGLGNGDWILHVRLPLQGGEEVSSSARVVIRSP